MSVGGNDDPRIEAFMRALGATVRRDDPVPPSVVAAAKASYTWRSVDSELAALTYDSFEDDRSLALVRGGDDRRALTFEYADVVIDLEVVPGAQGRTVTGQVVPAEVRRLEFHHGPADEPRVVSTDGLGRFRLDAVTPGPMRLLCQFVRPAPTSMLLTEWVVI